MKEIKKENCYAHDVGLLIKCDDWEQVEQQILQDQKLRESLKKTIKEIGSLERYFAMIFCYGVPDKFLPLGTKSYENTKPIPWVNWDEVHAKLQKLLEDNKNEI